MKKLLAVLLLLLICLLSCMLPVRYGMKRAAKMIMHQRLQHDHEKTFVLIAATDLTTAEWQDDREFRLDGHLYDVAGIEYHKGLKYYRCVSDDLEIHMEHRADDMTNAMIGHGENKSQGKIARAFLSWLQELYFQPPQVPSIYLLSGVKNSFFVASVNAVEDPFPDSRIIPPEA